MARQCHIAAAKYGFANLRSSLDHTSRIAARPPRSSASLAAVGVSTPLPSISSGRRRTMRAGAGRCWRRPGRDGDVVLGSDNAPVTIIEYASMTCPHCAHFSETTFPELKKQYIDTGKVRYILREFPLDALAAAGFMLARCAGKDKYMPLVETLFAKQDEWVGQATAAAAQGDRQAVRLYRAVLRSMPGESEGARRHPGGARSRRGEASASIRHRRFSSTARSWSAMSRSTTWPRSSIPILRRDKGFSPCPGLPGNVAPALPS